MKRKGELAMALIALAALIGCTRQTDRPTEIVVATPSTPELTATATLVPTRLPSPTMTLAPSGTAPAPTPLRSPTLAPAATPTAMPRLTAAAATAVTLGPPMTVEHAGFSYRPVIGYRATYRSEMAIITSDDGQVVVGIGGGLVPEETAVIDTIQRFLVSVATDIQDFSAGEPYTRTIGGIDARAIDIRGRLNGRAIEGRIAHASPSDLQFFLAFGHAPERRWPAEGSPLFEQLLDSITFFDAAPIENLCPVTADPDYGYSRNSPIRVGEGTFFTGPALERAYLDQLRGPHGETIEYERLGSESHGDTILDAYQVTYSGTTVVLYLDMYHKEPFKVPIGFTCAW